MKTIEEFEACLNAEHAKLLKQHTKQYNIASKIWSMLHAGDTVYKYDKSSWRRGYIAYTIIRFDSKHLTAKCKRQSDDVIETVELIDLCIMSKETNRMLKLYKLCNS